MTTLEELKNEVDKIKARNERVEKDKAWETSWTRKLLVFVLTYFVVVIFFFVTNLPKPFVNSLVPTLGFFLSTLTVPWVVDARKHKGGKLGEKKFRKEIEKFLSDEFPKTRCLFKLTPSYTDILLELADFISNTFYKEYQKDSDHVFQKLGFRLVQIKNPL